MAQSSHGYSVSFDFESLLDRDRITGECGLRLTVNCELLLLQKREREELDLNCFSWKSIIIFFMERITTLLPDLTRIAHGSTYVKAFEHYFVWVSIANCALQNPG